MMLTRLTADGRLALPKALLASFPGVDCFNATVEQGRLVLRPVQLGRETTKDVTKHHSYFSKR